MTRQSAATFALVAASLLVLTLYRFCSLPEVLVPPSTLPIQPPVAAVSVVDHIAQPDKMVPPDPRPGMIDAYMKRRHAPLEGQGEVFVGAADQCGLDWRLVAAMSIRESSGGKEACGFNPLGWRSCRGYNFETWDEAIEYVTSRLCESPIYKGKSTRRILETYNPPVIIPLYAQEVENIMEKIGPI